jgi:Holliday junction DNA helicase RuvA
LTHVSPEAIVVEAGGVGYLVHVAPATLAGLPRVGSPVWVYTYLNVKEDSLTLYGFTSLEQRQMFELLLGVSGVGPKSALTLVSSFPLRTLVNAITQQDTAVLTKIPGIGAKLAQRVCLELHEKVGLLSWSVEERGAGGAHVDEAIEALMSLGFTQAEARRAALAAARQLGTEAALEDLLREALKRLGGG